jgi:autophagy-related protein 5
MSYLPLAMEKVRAHFAPHTEPPGSEMWVSAGGRPLRWHLPTGLLFDLLAGPRPDLPWPLTVHFSAFPADTLLPCPGREAVESVFMAALKESDQLKHGGKVMKQMQKKDHSQLWLGLASDKPDQFWSV